MNKHQVELDLEKITGILNDWQANNSFCIDELDSDQLRLRDLSRIKVSGDWYQNETNTLKGHCSKPLNEEFNITYTCLQMDGSNWHSPTVQIQLVSLFNKKLIKSELLINVFATAEQAESFTGYLISRYEGLQ